VTVKWTRKDARYSAEGYWTAEMPDGSCASIERDGRTYRVFRAMRTYNFEARVDSFSAAKRAAETAPEKAS
jgi:hypothetical protein